MPGAFVAVDVAELEQPQRQLAVAALTTLEDQAVHRAVHRLHVVRAVVHLHRRVHAVGVPLEVPGGLEQLPVREMRGVDELVAAGLVAQAAVVLHELADDRALGVPHRQATTQLLGEREEVELVGQLAMVALGGLLELMEVLGERLLRLPCGAVEALQHLGALVAAPVRAGDLLQLEEAELAGGRDVGADAHVDELVGVAVRRDDVARHLARIEFVGAGRLHAFDDLDLVRLVGEQLLRFGHRVFRADEGLVLLDDLLHLLLDAAEVVLVERLAVGQVEVVVEAVLDGGPDRELRTRVELGHRLGEHMGGRVTQHVAPRLGVARDDRDDVTVGEFGGQIGVDPVDRGGDRCLAEAGSDRRGEVERRRRCGEFARRAIRQRDGNHS